MFIEPNSVTFRCIVRKYCSLPLQYVSCVVKTKKYFPQYLVSCVHVNGEFTVGPIIAHYSWRTCNCNKYFAFLWDDTGTETVQEQLFKRMGPHQKALMKWEFLICDWKDSLAGLHYAIIALEKGEGKLSKTMSRLLSLGYMLGIYRSGEFLSIIMEKWSNILRCAASKSPIWGPCLKL